MNLPFHQIYAVHMNHMQLWDPMSTFGRRQQDHGVIPGGGGHVVEAQAGALQQDLARRRQGAHPCRQVRQVSEVVRSPCSGGVQTGSFVGLLFFGSLRASPGAEGTGSFLQ